MAVGHKLSLVQNQSLVMTPQLQQAIKLLQLSNGELARYIEQELERNPMLERDDRQLENPMSYTACGTVSQPEPSSVDLSLVTCNAGEAKKTEISDYSRTDSDQFTVDRETKTENIDTDAIFDSQAWDSGVDDGTNVSGSDSWGRLSQGNRDGDHNFELNLISRPNLREHITSQINIDFQDPVERVLALQLMDMLDESGYLRGDLDCLANSLNCRVEQVEAVLGDMQTFDPPGIFARDLKECLKIQLVDSGRFDDIFDKLLNSLPLIAQGEWAKLCRLTRLGEGKLRVYLQEIKSLQPKPALEFEAVSAHTVTPDVLLSPAPSGGWIVELNQANLPRVLVNNSYVSRVSRASVRKEDRTFIMEQVQSANWLMKALHQRATTILKVASAIVQVQEDFFSRGVQFLRPLVLKEIAERVGIHESTVSRVTNSKFMQTPRGMFELKYFFNVAISGSDGQQSYSSETVRAMIRSMVSMEDKDDVLSDDTIVRNLEKNGVAIARRTVAKYREAMRIPSSVKRRREKALS